MKRKKHIPLYQTEQYQLHHTGFGICAQIVEKLSKEVRPSGMPQKREIMSLRERVQRLIDEN